MTGSPSRRKTKAAPLRGVDAWMAAKQRVADHNEATHARAREERAGDDLAFKQRQREADSKDAETLPGQPGRH